MTVGEIWAIVWAKGRHNRKEEMYAELYDDLLELKGLK